MKKWEEAEKDASKAIEMDPKNAKVITNNKKMDPKNAKVITNYKENRPKECQGNCAMSIRASRFMCNVDLSSLKISMSKL